MRLPAPWIGCVSALVAAAAMAQSPPGPDPFEFFRPAAALTAGERSRIDAGEAIVKAVSSGERQVAIFSVARINADGDRLVAWVRQIADLKRGRFVSGIRRFSQPPQLADLDGLALDDTDLDDLRRCHSGDCGLKLSDREIDAVQRTIATAGDGWREAVQRTFRGIVFQRVQQYLAEGHTGVGPYHDRDAALSLQDEFAAVLDQSTFLTTRLPQLADHLRHHPTARAAGVESFLYWSKETLGGKAIVSASHVNIVRGGDPALPDALVAAKQLFATHYLTGSLATTAIVGRAGSPRYLVYLNRSRVDVLGGVFGGLVRRVIERRLRTEAAGVVEGLRRRIEGGLPPQASASRSSTATPSVSVSAG